MSAITKPDDSMQVGRDESVPDFLRLEQIPVNYIQQVETDLLEPVVFTQGTATSKGFARFTLQNKGFLHSHSKQQGARAVYDWACYEYGLLL